MQIIFDSKEKTILRLDKGEEVFDVLTRFSEERDQSSHFSMIGGCEMVEVGCYDMIEQNYIFKEFREITKNIEILACEGNVAWFEGKPFIHMHGSFASHDYQAFGGHVNKMVILVTGEVFINWLPEKLKREDAGGCLRLLVK